MTDLPKPPRFFVPEAEPSPLPSTFSEPQALDQLRYHEETWAVVADAGGALRAMRSEDCRGFGAEISRALNAHELASPLRGLRSRGVWLFAMRRLEHGLQVPGLNDPVEVAGTLFGPFPSETPQAWSGRLTTTRAELLEGLVRGAWHPFRFRRPGLGAGEHSVIAALLAGNDTEDVAAGHGVVLAYPLGASPLDRGEQGNDEAVRKLLFDLLSAMRVEQRAETGGALSQAALPVPDRASLEASLAEDGFQIRGDQAVRARPGLLGRLFPEKRELPPGGTTADFLALARLALGELSGWPSARATALRRVLDLEEISWSADGPRGLELMPGQGVIVGEGVLTSPPPAKAAPTKPGRAGVVEATYRQVYFHADPAFAQRTTRMSFEYEYLDVRPDPSAAISANYDSPGEPHRYLNGPAFQGSGVWRWVKGVAEDVELRRRGYHGSDLRVQFSTVEPLRLRRVVLRRLPDAARAEAPPIQSAPAPAPMQTSEPAGAESPESAVSAGPREVVTWPADRWERLHQCELKVEGGHLVVASTGNDPHLHGPAIKAQCPVVLELRMRASAAGFGEVFCQTEAYPRYEIAAAGFPVTGGGEPRDYRIRIHELGVITRLRLDPCDAPGTYVIEAAVLRPLAPPALPPAPRSDRIVYFDPRYTSAWGQGHAFVAERLEKQGFAIASADELAGWMLARLDGTAPGSVCVLAHDTLPDTVFETARPQCLARRYLDAGGRLVHAGHFPFTLRGLPDGERPWAAGSGAPNRAIPCDCQDGNADPELTEEGRAFGLTRAPPNRLHLTSAAQVTVVLSRVGRFYAAAWLRTFAPEHPGSGLLRFSNEGLAGRDEARVDELGRVALHGLPAPRLPSSSP